MRCGGGTRGGLACEGVYGIGVVAVIRNRSAATSMIPRGCGNVEDVWGAGRCNACELPVTTRPADEIPANIRPTM